MMERIIMKKGNNKDFRKEFLEKVLKSLENETTWKKAWSYVSGSPQNAFTHRKYSGINSMSLKFIENEKGYGDPRWATFRQIKEAGLKVKKGSHGEKVEYHFVYDKEEKAYVSWSKYNMLKDEEKANERYSIHRKYFTVFNGTQIEGLKPFVVFKNDIKIDKLVKNIRKALGVDIEYKNNSSCAYYSSAEDKIIMPEVSQFCDAYSYNAVALHELSHSTGHEKRLNRDITGIFGSNKYAQEELIAELSSCFLSRYSKNIATDEHLKNHCAYLADWRKMIKEDGNQFFKAIKEAEKAADYIIDKAKLDVLLETEIEVENHKDEFEL